MRALTASNTLVVLGLLLIFGGFGCGGGGTAPPVAPPPSDALFSGTYGTTTLGGDGGPPVEMVATWGTADPDGAGGGSGTTHANVGGGLLGPTTGPVEYAVDPTRVLHFTSSLLGGAEVVRGGIAADGMVAAGAGVLAPLTPTLTLLVRRGGAAFSNASVYGSYHACGWLCTATPGTNYVQFGDMTFSGPDVASLGVGWNREGVINPPIATLGAFSVTAGGEITLTFAAGSTLEGTVLAGGDLVVLGGATGLGEGPWLLVLVRKSTTASAATLAGPYFAVGMTWRIPASSYVNHTGTITSNGVAALALSLVEHEEGAVTGPLSDTAAYAVAPDGAVTITTSSGDTLVGGVSADGRYGVVSGPTNALSNPQLWFLLR